jgi:hypothetical protein
MFASALAFATALFFSCQQPKASAVLGDLVFAGASTLEKDAQGHLVLRWEKPEGNIGSPEFLVYMQTLTRSAAHPDGLSRAKVNWKQGIAPAISGALMGILLDRYEYTLTMPLRAEEAYAFQVRLRADGKIDENATVLVMKIPADPTPTPSPSPTETPTETPTVTPTATPSPSPTPTATPEETPTPGESPTATPSPTATSP